MPIFLKQLKYEERATWGQCPVCGAAHGEMCRLGTSDTPAEMPADTPIHIGAHLARLFNAPQVAALEKTA